MEGTLRYIAEVGFSTPGHEPNQHYIPNAVLQIGEALVSRFYSNIVLLQVVFYN